MAELRRRLIKLEAQAPPPRGPTEKQAKGSHARLLRKLASIHERIKLGGWNPPDLGPEEREVQVEAVRAAIEERLRALGFRR